MLRSSMVEHVGQNLGSLWRNWRVQTRGVWVEARAILESADPCFRFLNSIYVTWTRHRGNRNHSTIM